MARKWMSCAITMTAVVGMTAVAGCSSAPSDNSGTTLVWNVDPSSSGLYEQLADAFEEQNPGITVQLTEKVSDTDTNRATITNAIAGGSSEPDVFLGDVVWTAQFAASGLLADLDGKLSDDTLGSVSDVVLQTGQYDGKQYCMPFFTDAGILYYRTDLLEAAGLPVPTTWEELAVTAQQLQDSGTVANGLVYRGAPYEGTTVFWTELMADAGGSSVNEDYSSADVGSDAGRTVMDFLTMTLDSGISPAAVSTFKEPEALNVFASGDAAFMSSNAYMYGASQDPDSSQVVGKVGIAPLPTFEGHGDQGYSGSGGGNLCVNPNSDHVDEAAQLIDFMLTPAAQEIVTTVGGLIPANEEVQADPAMAESNPVLPLLPDLQIVNRPAGTENYSELSRAIFTNVNTVLTGGDVANSLGSMQSQIDSALQ